MFQIVADIDTISVLITVEMIISHVKGPCLVFNPIEKAPGKGVRVNTLMFGVSPDKSS